MASRMVALALAASSVQAVSFRSRGPSSVEEAITGEATALKDKHCGAHTLCGSCLLEPDCVWCADGRIVRARELGHWPDRGIKVQGLGGKLCVRAVRGVLAVLHLYL